MSYRKILEEGIAEANKMINDPVMRDALSLYDRKTFVLNVSGDARYVFRISSKGISMEVNPPVQEDMNDMYVEMDRGRAEKLIVKQNFGISDFISGKFSGALKWRNVSEGDIKFFRSIFNYAKKKNSD